MKMDKNKIVFIAIIACVVLFIGSYAIYMMGDNEEPTLDANQIPVPELEDNQKEYNSKLDALNDLKEVRETNAPSIYDERLLDSTGTYDPNLLEKEKMRLVDSIYEQGKINYTQKSYANIPVKRSSKPKVLEKKKDTVTVIEDKETNNQAKERALEHQLFFASHPVKNELYNPQFTDEFIYVRVDGKQTVKNNYRLQMRLLKQARINNNIIPKNTAIYGFVSFQPNRTLIKIENINHKPVKLTAHDFQDGSKGIYIENSFRAEVTNQIIGDVVDDINITGVPQVSGIKQIFQKNHRNVKVTIADNYKLILKIEQDKPKFQFPK